MNSFDFEFESLINLVNEEFSSDLHPFLNDFFIDDIPSNLVPELDSSLPDRLQTYGSESNAQAQPRYPTANIHNTINVARHPTEHVSEAIHNLTQAGGQPSQDEVSSSAVAHKPRARSTLKAWVAEHSNILYPSSGTKSHLSKRTGLSVKQISTWFANYRQRRSKPVGTLPTQSSEDPSMLPKQNSLTNLGGRAMRKGEDTSRSSSRISSHHVAAPSSPQRPLSASHSGYHVSVCGQDFGPVVLALGYKSGDDFLDAWYATLPSDGCYDQIVEFDRDVSDRTKDAPKLPPRGEVWRIGPESTAANAIACHQTGLTTDVSRSPNRRRRSSSMTDQRPNKRLRRTPSVVSIESLAPSSGGYDRYSAISGGTRSSKTSGRSSRSRRGRRIQRCPSVSHTKPYHCPKCEQGFSRKSGMTRHINSICEPPWEWTCRPIEQCPIASSPGGDISTEYGLPPLCLCGRVTSLCDHKMLECWQKEEIDRTFYRVDHIRKHLRDTHGLGSYNLAEITLSQLQRPVMYVPVLADQSPHNGDI